MDKRDGYAEEKGGKARDADFYLKNMPIAYCAVEVLTDGEGHPDDCRYVYCNKAYARIVKQPYGTLEGKRGMEVYGTVDRELLRYCYDAASHGTEHVLKDYSPDEEKHFLIYIYPLEEGLCGCVLQDVTEHRRMEQKLLLEHEKRKSFLEATTEIDFEYDFATGTLAFGSEGDVSKKNQVIKGGLEGLVKNGVIKERDRARIENAFQELKKGKKAVEFNIEARLEGSGRYCWYTVSSSSYVEQKTGHMRVVGYLRNIEQLIRTQAALKKEAMYDPLVELYNVKTGREMVTEALKEMGENESGIMFLIDIDDFKQINDTYGHQKGDEVLKQFADILKHVFRRSDIVYRMGGDEFIGFAVHVSQPDQAVDRIMERLYSWLDEADKDGFAIHCSAGVFVGSGKSSYSDFYKMADQALYAAKRAGKNKYRVIRESE